MSSDINQVALTARLTRDGELRQTQGGMSVLSLRLAFNTRKSVGNGRYEDAPNYIEATMFGKLAEALAPYMLKGQMIAVQGQLQWSEWDDRKAGIKRSAIKVIVSELKLCGGGNSTTQRLSGGNYKPAQPILAADQVPQQAYYEQDIPF